METDTIAEVAGLNALAEALSTAAAASGAHVAVLRSGRLSVVASYPEVPPPAPVPVAARTALASALDAGRPLALGDELSAAFGGQAHLVLPLSAGGIVLGAVVLVDPPAPAAALEAVGSAIPLAAAHLETWIEMDGALRGARGRLSTEDVVRQLADAVSDVVRVVDLDGRVLRWNVASERLYGWTEEEVLDTVLPTVPPERRGAFLVELRAVAESMRPVEREAQTIRKDGSRATVQLGLYPMVRGNGEVAVVVISRGVSADSRVDRLRDEFCDLVSDALKAPLTAIAGFAQLLRRGEIVHDQLRRQRVLGALEGKTALLGTMIDDLLLLSEVQQGELKLDSEPLDLVALVTESVAEAERACAACRFVVDVERRLPPLAGDPRRIRLALAHLLSNAATYSPPDGEIWVTVSREGDEAAIGVRDLGEGIPAEDLPHVFERFFRGSRARGGGSGVGLHVVRLVAEAHGGEAAIESVRGEGCLVTLRLRSL